MIYRLEEPTGVIHWVSDRDAHDAHFNTYKFLKAKNHLASFDEMFSDVQLIRGPLRRQNFTFNKRSVNLLIEDWEAIYSPCGFVYIMEEMT